MLGGEAWDLASKTRIRGSCFWPLLSSLAPVGMRSMIASCKILRQSRFDAFVEKLCRPHYAEKERPSIPPGRHFRMHFVGDFEGIDSERGIEWRCADSLSLREFLQLAPLAFPVAAVRPRRSIRPHSFIFETKKNPLFTTSW